MLKTMSNWEAKMQRTLQFRNRVRGVKGVPSEEPRPSYGPEGRPPDKLEGCSDP